MLLRLISNAPAGTTLDLVNGSVVTGYTILNTIDFGNAAWQHAMSGARGTQGARPSVGEPDNRVVSIPVHIGPTGSVDSFNVKAANLVEIVDELRRFGGRILYQATGQTPRQYLDVMLCGTTRESWGRKGARTDSGDITILASCAPYMLGDPMDSFDGFDTDTLTAGDWTFDIANSGAGALSIAGGQLVPGATGLKRLRYTKKGYTYGDVLVGLKVHTGATLTGGVWGISARVNIGGTDVSITGEVLGTTTAPRISFYGGAGSASGAAFNPAANSDFWMVLLVQKQQVFFKVYTVKPTLLTTPVVSTSATFTLANAQTYGAPGHAGIRITAADTAERYDDFRLEPFTFIDPGGNSAQPNLTRFSCPIPGDVPAMVDATVTPRAGTVSPISGILAYHERALLSNDVWNGDFEDANIAAAGWSPSIVAGVLTAAGTSVARITTAGNKYGVGALRIVTPATTDAGATFRVNSRRYKTGDLVLAWAWLSSVAGTTSTVIKAGLNANIATGTAAALSATPKLYAVLWTLSGAGDQPYVVIAQAAATATNIDVDGVGLCLPPVVTLAAAIVSTSATTLTVAATPPSETPNILPDGTISAPFLALIDLEIVRVTAIAGNVWTVDRGQEGTTAATHLISTFVGILPPLRPHYEGKGANPAFGIVEAEDYVSTLSSPGAGTFSISADGTARLSNWQLWTPLTSGAQLATYVYLVDPNVLMPDDYTLGELDVEVWLREKISASLTGQRVTLSAQPEGGTAFGPERFTREYGSTGKLLAASTATSSRLHRLGSLPMIVDRANPQRWRLKLALSATGGAAPGWYTDTLFLVPTRGRLASPTGEANDTATTGGAYPPFVPYDAAWGATSGMSKTMRADGSALIAAPGGYGFPDQGMGDVLEMPDTDIDFFVRCSNLVPDDPTLDTTGEPTWTIAADVHFAVTPRYVYARAV